MWERNGWNVYGVCGERWECPTHALGVFVVLVHQEVPGVQLHHLPRSHICLGLSLDFATQLGFLIQNLQLCQHFGAHNPQQLPALILCGSEMLQGGRGPWPRGQASAAAVLLGCTLTTLPTAALRPQSAEELAFELSVCECDLLAGLCDLNCCCDPDCGCADIPRLLLLPDPRSLPALLGRKALLVGITVTHSLATLQLYSRLLVHERGNLGLPVSLRRFGPCSLLRAYSSPFSSP